MMEESASALEKRPDVIGQPQPAEDRAHGAGEVRRQVAFGHHQRNIFRHAVISPYFEDVLHQLRLLIEALPRYLTWLERIVLKRDKREVRKASVLLQVRDEASHP